MAELPKASARLSQIERGDLPADQQHIFDEIAGSRGAVRGPFAMLLHSPEVAGRIAHTGAYIRFETTLPDDLRELAILTTARFWDCQYEWTAHEPAARNAGLEEEIIELLRFGRPLADAGALPGLGARERTIIRVARELINEPKVSAETFVEAQTLFGNKGVMDLTGLVGYYTFVNYTLKTFDLQRTPGSQLLLPLP